MLDTKDNASEQLNPQQQAAAETTEGPVMILAGAGSGKTKVLVHRIANMIRKKIDPGSILAITFTNKAAREMRERVKALAGEEAREVWLYTFHSFCAKILRQETASLSGYHQGFTIYDTDDCKKLLKDILKNDLKDEAQYMPDTGELMERLTKLKWNKNHYEAVEREARAGNEYQKRILTASEIYNKKLKRNNAMDFEDLLVQAIKLFRNEADILAKYQEQFKYIMVDEYQDTNQIQYELVELLSKKHRNLCVVGDADQSIYSWRGADITNILGFRKDYPECKTIKLEQNYRSTKEIIEAANNVIKNNQIREDKTLFTEKEGAAISIEEFENDFKEAEYVAEAIKEYHEKYATKYQDFAVLYRTNSMSKKIETEFIKKGIPYSITGGTKLFERKEIKDIIAYLKVLANPYDDYSLRRIINVPARGFGPATLQKAQEMADAANESLVDTITSERIKEAIPKHAEDFEKFALFIIDMTTLKYDGAGVRELISEILKRTSYTDLAYPEKPKRLANEKDADYKIKEKKAKEEHEKAAKNIESLVQIAKAYDEGEDGEHTLEEFLNNVMLISEQDEENKDDIARMMTLHSSKGLEFPCVFIIGLEENTLPYYKAIGECSEAEALEEERRLFYVGVTRAKEKLILTSSKQRFINGKKEALAPSRFLGELKNKS